jgi:hypothetical protein
LFGCALAAVRWCAFCFAGAGTGGAAHHEAHPPPSVPKRADTRVAYSTGGGGGLQLLTTACQRRALAYQKHRSAGRGLVSLPPTQLSTTDFEAGVGSAVQPRRSTCVARGPRSWVRSGQTHWVRFVHPAARFRARPKQMPLRFLRFPNPSPTFPLQMHR